MVMWRVGIEPLHYNVAAYSDVGTVPVHGIDVLGPGDLPEAHSRPIILWEERTRFGRSASCASRCDMHDATCLAGNVENEEFTAGDKMEQAELKFRNICKRKIKIK